jgi:hypothetical protein
VPYVRNSANIFSMQEKLRWREINYKLFAQYLLGDTQQTSCTVSLPSTVVARDTCPKPLPRACLFAVCIYLGTRQTWRLRQVPPTIFPSARSLPRVFLGTQHIAAFAECPVKSTW